MCKTCKTKDMPKINFMCTFRQLTLSYSSDCLRAVYVKGHKTQINKCIVCTILFLVFLFICVHVCCWCGILYIVE